MSWADTLKATALTALARRTSTVGRVSTDAPWSWNMHDAWLTRARQPHSRTAPSSTGEPSSGPYEATAPHD
jgi:hypothetical protein